jgi:hypothetical protein
MLKQFNSNVRKLNRVIQQINLNNLSGSGYLDNLIDDYKIQINFSASLDGRGTTLNPLSEIETGSAGQGGYSNLPNELSASTAYNYNTSFDISIPTKFNSNTKSNPNSIKVVNNKTTISDFYQEILENSARYVKRSVDSFNNDGFGTLTILNVTLDYGTEGASPNNFEVLVFGLHIPGNYKIEEVGNNVVITLNEQYIDYDNVTINDIYVMGKLKDIPIGTELDIVLSTENDEEIIL